MGRRVRLSATGISSRVPSMMHLELGGKRIPIAAGETIIGSAPGCAIVLPGEGVQPQHAVLHGTREGAAAIRAANPEADLRVNGIRIGADPTPVLHGDKIRIGSSELLAVDSRRVGNTQLFDSGAFTDLVPKTAKPAAVPAATGGRLVCLTDGREYMVGSAPLVFGRDAASDVVVTGNEVSRRHAEIQTSPEGYVLMDLSVNGTYVNGERIGRSHLLARADVIRIGNDEFRFYAESAPPQAPRAPRQTPPSTEPVHPPTGAGARLSDTMHGFPSSGLREMITPPAATAAPLASMLVRSGSLKGTRLPIRTPVANIGRADYNDVVIGDPSVSTTHAKLQRRESLWILNDLGSTNGTTVDGEPLTGEAVLSPGATIRFGEVAVLFEPLDDGEAAERPAGTRMMERLDVAPAAPPEPSAVAEETPGPERRERTRRPIRASAPRPSGPPVWLITLVVLLGMAIAYFILSSH
jgi:pSer/pThr/pTyr-binding forkhead associated (FHA) protein